MCGRYVSPESAAIERAFHIGQSNSNPFGRRLNVLPTEQVPIVRRARDRDLELTLARWGFAPGWWKEPKPPTNTFNARSEEAPDKPMWRHSLTNARCILPAEGWYEWQAVERPDPDTGEIKVVKQPHYIFRRDRRLVGIGGLMSLWHPSADSAVLTCAILTRDAPASVAVVHDRMPVVLSEEKYDAWLDPSLTDSEGVAELVSTAEMEFEHYPVTPRLNSAKTDEEDFTREWKPEPPAAPRTRDLFS